MARRQKMATRLEKEENGTHKLTGTVALLHSKALHEKRQSSVHPQKELAHISTRNLPSKTIQNEDRIKKAGGHTRTQSIAAPLTNTPFVMLHQELSFLIASPLHFTLLHF